MARFHPSLVPVLAIALGACCPLFAQTAKTARHVKQVPSSPGIDQPPSARAKTVPASSLAPFAVPFNTQDARNESSYAIRMIPESEMSREDRDVLADGESSIQERAGVENLDFNGAGWTHNELVCPALPKHLFVRFARDDGTRQMSMFSAAIPRDGNGRVHIIPIVRKGYSLFSPAPIGAMTIAAFNRIRAEEGAGAAADWLGTALCYAALAGANPQAGKPLPPDSPDFPAIMPPTLTTSSAGGATVRFADTAATPKPMEWTLVFDPKGRLLKAAHVPAAFTILPGSNPAPEPK